MRSTLSRDTLLASHSSANKSESSEARTLASMLKTAESLFFSMPIPEEIVAKYNYLKESKFKLSGIEFAPITRAQFPAIGTAPPKSVASQDSASFDAAMGVSVGLIEGLAAALAELVGKLRDQDAMSMKFWTPKMLGEVKAKLQKMMREAGRYASGTISRDDNVSQFLKTLDGLSNRCAEQMKEIGELCARQIETLRGLRNENALLQSNVSLKQNNVLAEAEMLKKKLDETAAEHQAEVEGLNAKHSKEIAELKTQVGKLDEIKEKLREYRSNQDVSGAEADQDELGYAEFLMTQDTKLRTDNQWLVEQLAAFSRENDTLHKKAGVDPDVVAQLTGEARNSQRLIEAFYKSHAELLVKRYVRAR